MTTLPASSARMRTDSFTGVRWLGISSAFASRWNSSCVTRLTRGIAAVLRVAAMAGELVVAGLAVAGDRGVVGHVHLETDGAAATRDRGRFGGREQHRADPASSDMGCDRDGIETGDDRARPKQHDGTARDPVAGPSHDQLRAGRL